MPWSLTLHMASHSRSVIAIASLVSDAPDTYYIFTQSQVLVVRVFLASQIAMDVDSVCSSGTKSIEV